MGRIREEIEMRLKRESLRKKRSRCAKRYWVVDLIRLIWSRFVMIVSMGSVVRYIILNSLYVLWYVEFLMQIAMVGCFGLGLGFI